MTDQPAPDLGAAMALLLEQELMAAIPRSEAPAPAPLPEIGAPAQDRRLEDDVLRIAAAALRLPADQVDPTENLANYGVDSIAITEVMVQISRAYAISVAPTTFFEARHLNDLARILRERYGKAIAAHYAKTAPPPAAKTPETGIPETGGDVAAWLKRHRAAFQKPAPKAAPKAAQDDIPVAIIAMAGMFPQSPDLDAFEAHLRRGDDCMEEIPAGRWDWRAVHGDPRQGPFTDVRWGGFVPDHDRFDAAFFNISPREAELMDPQHRLFMECVWTLIESAGHAPSSLAGSKVGLFLGINLLDYTNMVNRAGIMDARQLTGLGHAFCPNRLSFLLDIHGPSQVVDTACSSSLVALHRAVMSIRFEGCAMAIAGGSNLLLSPDQHIMFSQVGMISPRGRCRAFARDADGYARADGVGAVLLKRLDLAERDGDTILAVIRASAEHHGGTATSLTAPNPQAQARLIVEAHHRAGIDPRSVGLMECHGTGTPLGDPIEVEGLKTAFAQLYAERGLAPPPVPTCGLGSVKSNIGHTETAAGIAGLIKVLLAMRHGILYRTLHCEEPNPLVTLEGSPFYLLTEARPWTRPLVDGIEQPRRAGLSSFGAGGANVHVLLEEYRAPAAAAQPGPRPVVVPVSARSEDALRRAVANLRPLVEGADLDDLSHTLQVGRDALRARLAFVARDAADLARQMDDVLAGRGDAIAHGTAGRRRNETIIDDTDPARIAARWVTGETMDWSRLHGTARRRRLPLPTTPFERKRFWLPEAAAPEAGFAPRQDGTDRYVLTLRGDEFFLADHRLRGQPVLPGVAYLELARLVAGLAGETVTGLRKVIWVQPMLVTAPLTVEITVIRDATGTAREVEIASLPAGSPRRLHAQMRLGDGAPAPARSLDLNGLRAAHAHGVAAARIYAAFDAMGLNYGPGHRAIAQMFKDGDGRQVLARLILPAGTTLAGFALHPSLMDGAFQAAIGMAPPGGDEAALPFAIESVDILGPCCAEMWVHIRAAAGAEAAPRVQSLDLDLMDGAGEVRVRLRGFATRLPTTGRKADVQTFAPHWRPPLTASPVAFATRLALLCDGVAAEAPGWTCRPVGAGAEAPLEQRFGQLTQDVLAQLQALPAAGPALVQVVLPAGPDAGALAGIAGLLRSAGQERPAWRCQVLITGKAVDAPLLSRAAEAPAGALLRIGEDGLRQEVWSVTGLAAAPPPWRDGKVYLVTGGLGGLGRILAAHMRHAAPGAIIVLAGRSAPDAPARLWMERLGAEYMAADLADAGATAALVAEIRHRHGHLDGVIHAAGLIRDGALAGKTPEQVAAVLAPKVAGTLNLDRAIGTGPLDVFVLFSSLAGVLGGHGQSDYAAANGFLDGFAAGREERRRAGLVQGRTLAVSWPFWAEGGMEMAPETQALMTRTTGLAPLGTADGLAALAAALAGDAPRLLVAAGEAEKVRRHLEGESVPPPPAAAMVAPALGPRLLTALTDAAARQLKVTPEDLDPEMELTEYGFDSIGFTQFANALNREFDLELTPTVFFEQPTLQGLAGHLAQTHGAALAARLGVVAAEAPTLAPVTAAPPPVMARPAGAPGAVAVIGMSGIFPQAADVEAFWRNLEQGRDCITEIPPDRWDWRAIWGDPVTEPGKCNVRWGGFMDAIGAFDAGFFGLSAPEARMMDPQQRLLLTQAWRVMEDAGYAPRRLSGSSTGVFIGTADTGYGRLLAQAGAGVEGYSMTGLAPSLGPNRISFHFNFHGPSVAVETACSSALVAVHRAVEAIAAGHCQTAIAGGVNALLLPDAFVGFAKAGMLAPDGRCKPFSAAANGYARGEGVGLVFLKALDAAERDGDRILAVIRASGENHGGRAGTLTAPNPKAQADLLRMVYGRAGFDPRTVGYIEAHGTGTPLGDPIEVEALAAAFADLAREAEAVHGPAPAMTCGLGSVKSNIGHLELAAGIAGLIKVLLQLRHATLARTLHCDRLNPYLKLEGSPFQVVRDTAPWPSPRDAAGRVLPRRAGVSSFGFGGSNAHVVLEEYLPPPPMESPPADGPALMVLSAHSPDALGQCARDLRDVIAAGDDSLADIAQALQTRRDAMEHRLAFACAGRAEALHGLDAFLGGGDDPALVQGRVKGNRGAITILESDDVLRQAIAGLAARGRADNLLALWVRGFAVDWAAVNRHRPARRVALPPYPLAATSYWVNRAEPAPAPAPPPPVIPAAVAAPDDSAADALAALSAIAARVLEVDASVLDPDAELGEFGFDSITMTGFAAKVNAELGLSLSPADFFEFATLARLAAHIAGSTGISPRKQARPAAAVLPEGIIAPVPPAEDDPIAITGFSCHFPQSPDAEAFWETLLSGRDCITEIPADRWDWRAIDGDPKQDSGKTNIRWGGFIDGVFAFDPLFFGISPREARLMDPQQRLLLTHVWKAVEDSGHAPRSLAGRAVGLFVGTSSSGYRDSIGNDTGAEGYVATGAVPSVGPNRASYFLDWHGPSEPVETACSSSLVALHHAIQAMRAGDCDMAVVGGVNTIITPEAHINFAKAGMLSPDGRCRTFSAQANGYVRGEGIGLLVLKRLSEAERDGDPICAVVRATAVNHGGRANSLTAPNTAAQAELLRRAMSGLDPRSIGYIEAHGTGTALGDPVEINALKAAFGPGEGGGCAVGSVKTNIGHLELAAGAAGLIKVLLQLRHATLAPSLHCAEINPYIDLTGSPLRILRAAEPWQAPRDAAGHALPRRAGISSFGFGGVNAHAIIEEYRAPPPPPPQAGPMIIVLSARDGERLKDQARALLAAMDAGRIGADDLADLAYTLQVGRDAMKQRLAVVADSLEQVRARLSAFVGGDPSGVLTGRRETGRKAGPALDPRGDPHAAAARWVAGADMDWPLLYSGRRRRLRLPGYAFAPETYRIDTPVSGREYAIQLDSDAFYLRDHKVRGACILPGAMGLELARAAFAAGGPFAPVGLGRVVWQHPLRLESGTVTARVPVSDGSFSLVTAGTPHMVGRIAALSGPAPAPMELERLRRDCPRQLAVDEFYDRYAALGLDYGPAFRAVTEVRLGTDQVLARLRLPDSAAGSAFALHPSMVDGAFQAALGLFADGGDGTTALPFGIDGLEVLAPTTPSMWAHLRRGAGGGGILRLDLDLADDEGRICLRITGFTLRVLKPEAPAAGLAEAALGYLTALVAREAAIPQDEIEAEAPLEAYGIDSVMIVRLTDALEADFGPLPRTLFFEYRTLAALGGYFLSAHAARLAVLLGPSDPTPPRGGPAPQPKPAAPPVEPGTPIAIIGLSGRYPGARDLDGFWRNLVEGRDCITEIPPERWDAARFFDSRPGQAGKTNSRWGGFVGDFDRFDPLFFNISPREAEFLDPQERLFLQCAWEALEDAGLTRATVAPAQPPLDGADVGVFVGVMYEEYQLYGVERTLAGQPLALSGSAASIANRVSYVCGFHGPSLAVDSMCSSSLSAIHLACESLRAGSCAVALAGGVNLSLHPNKYLGLAQGRFMSSSGRCESFGRGGDGYVPGEGVGAVLLKPLDRAVADGDRILGLIRASALNHGGKTNGYTVPNPDAQAAVIGKALAAAGVSPRAISYVEAHGTGTSLGDPIEIAALAKAYGAHTGARGFCAIGSVKSNIGHCESAAGMAGLTKVLLQLRHGTLVPSLHSRTLNPGIDFAATPFVVQQQAAPWRRPVIDGREQPRVAGLSSFGAGGANAHLIIEEYTAPARAAAVPPRRQVFPLSARAPERLDEMVGRLRHALDSLADSDMDSVAWGLQQGREAFEERLAVVAQGRDELAAALDRVMAGTHGPNIHRGRAARARPPAGGTDPDALAAAWVEGARTDWAALAAGRPVPPRLALPTYPFARERYWVPGAPEAKAAPALPLTPALPLAFVPDWREGMAGTGENPARALVVLCQPPPGLAERLSGAEVMVFAQADYDTQAARLLALLQRVFKERPERALIQVAVPLGSRLEGLGGMLRSARQERQGLTCQLVALDYGRADAAALLRADRASADTEIRHGESGRQVRRWRELPLRPAAASPWSDGGIYLITGGAGGVGLHLCRHLAAAARRPVLWLVGRSPLADEARRRLDALPARIEYRQADVGDGAAMTRLVDEILRAHGRLDGVLHAAGVTRDSLLVRKSAADLHAVLAPKVAGTLALDEATAALDLKMMVLFASVSGALGNAGQADYAAANAFLDSFAAERNRLVAQGQRRGHTVALDWPYWQDGGMRLPDEAIAAMERVAGVRPLATAPALAVLDAVVAAGAEEQVLVLDGDHARLRALLSPVEAKAPVQAPAASLAQVAACFAEVLKIPAERLGADTPLDQFGVDSVSALEIMAALERHWGPLPPTLLFEYPTIAAIGAELGRAAAAPEAPPPPPATAADGDIAIIAVAGRYPGARTVEELWTVLEEGRDCVTEVPPERWDNAPLYSPAKGKPGTGHCNWGGFVDDVACFDAGFFGYSPRAADLADPQERLFLETTWHLLERAGHTRARLRRHYAAKVGVFVGAMYRHYGALATEPESRALLSLGSYSAIANRVSFFFDLQGPSVAVDSMCSSGLQAVHQACQSLRAGECRLAIAGGVNLSLHSDKYLGLSRAGLVGSHAGSRGFADGDGYLPAEGVGAVLLKPLAAARADGDAILAVIKGSAANHGGHSGGFGVPSAEAQARLIEDNLRASGVHARSIGYVEAATSGAALGDAIEIRALGRAFGAFTSDVGFCAIGSVKTNMGHAEAASGLAQLTKVLLQLQHRRLVPSLKPARPNPAMDFTGTPFVPQWQAADWPAPVVDGRVQPRRATISSFGAGGSNVHLILEEAPEAAATPEARRPRPFPVSARTPGQLAETLAALADYVEASPGLSPARLSATLRQGREPMECAVQVVATHAAELAAKLRRAGPGTMEEAPVDEAGEASGPPLILPPYPFARERHWLAATVAEEAPSIDLTALILGVLARELGVAADTLDPDRSFAALGLDSMMALRLAYALEEATGVVPDRFGPDETPASLAATLAGRAAAAPPPAPSPGAPSPGAPSPGAMTEGQKGLWVVQSLHPQTGTYNVPLAFRLSGIDHDALARACRWLLEAYPILTARVQGEEDAPSLSPGPVAAPLGRIEVPKGMDPLDFARRLAARPFDLRAAPLSRFELLHGGALGDGHEILLVTVHHMAFDGTSAAVAAQALWRAYECFAAGREAPPAPPAADFTEFAAWERALMASPAGLAQRAYWLGRLQGELPVTELLADRAAAPGGAIDGRSLDRPLPAAAARKVRRLAARLGITPASAFLGLLVILLYRHTGQRDMVVGIPTLRRPSRRFAETLGYCANMVALRAAVPEGITAAALLGDVHRRMMEGLGNADYPFAAIARELGQVRPGEPPYQVSFAYQNFPLGEGIDLPEALGQVAFLPDIRQDGDGPFGLEVQEEGDGLRLIAGYDGNCFDAATIARLLDRLTRLAASVCAAPQTPVGRLEMLSAGERKRVLGRWAGPEPLPDQPGLLPHWIARQAKRRPDAVAVTADGDSLTYRRLVRRANRLARHLRRSGVRPGDKVAVLLGRGTASITALLATLSAGAVWVPLDSEAPRHRLAAMLDDCGAKAVITQGEPAPDPAVTVIDLKRDAAAMAKLPAGKLKDRAAAHSPAYMIYTSGSTGTPKGVVVSHGALADHCRAVTAHYRLGADDVVLQFAPHVVDTALEQILPTLAAGARLVLRTGPVWTADGLRRILAEQAITVADLPPAYLREVLLAWGEAPAPPALRLCLVGGEALAPDTVRLWRQSPLAAMRLVNAYGPTEATITCLVHEVKDTPPGAAIPIGRPLPGTRAFILDPDGNPLPEGMVGELCVGGSRLALGYHGRPDLTAGRFADTPLGRLYRTGDQASFVPGGDGLVAFHGRRDHQVKIRGFRVELSEVEATLRALGLSDAAVITRADAAGNPVLVAYVVGDADEGDLRARMAGRLPPHMLPAAYVRLSALPLTQGGKLDRAALPEAATGGPSGDTPRDGLEDSLRALWSRVLGVDAAAIGIHDDFHSRGGHSLLWLRLLAEMGRAFHCRPSAAAFAGATTIAHQAELLRRQGDGAGDDIVVPLRPALPGAQARAPLFLVHPVAGGVACYGELARRLDSAIPVYGLQAPEDDHPAADLPGLAARYVAALRRVQADGPYRLGGWSLGGVLAFEMARQLRRDGDEVALLCLIESYTPAVLARIDALLAKEGDEDPALTIFARDVLGLAVADLAGRFEAGELRRLYARFTALNTALMAYEPGPCDVPLTVLRTESGALADEACGWRDWAAAGLAVHAVPGDHASVLRPPALERCVAVLAQALTPSRELGLGPGNSGTGSALA